VTVVSSPIKSNPCASYCRQLHKSQGHQNIALIIRTSRSTHDHPPPFSIAPTSPRPLRTEHPGNNPPLENAMAGPKKSNNHDTVNISLLFLSFNFTEEIKQWTKLIHWTIRSWHERLCCQSQTSTPAHLVWRAWNLVSSK
jgi:hypothetical protein